MVLPSPGPAHLLVDQKHRLAFTTYIIIIAVILIITILAFFAAVANSCDTSRGVRYIGGEVMESRYIDISEIIGKLLSSIS